MSLPAIIFDLDGTLVDSIDDITLSLNHSLSVLGLPTHSRQAVAGMVGDGARMLVRRAVGAGDGTAPGGCAIDGETVEAVLSAFAAHYMDHCLDNTRLFPGMHAELDVLADAGWSMAILSNKPDVFTRLCAERLLDRWPFQRVVGLREGMPRKPEPAMALSIASELGRPPAAMYFVGDSPVDVRTARAAGMMAVAVTWGYRAAELLRECGPDLILDQPSELARALMAHHASHGS